MSNLKLIYLILPLFALFVGCNNSRVEQLQDSTSNDVEQQLQELITNGCFPNGNPSVVAMDETNPLKKYAITIESTKNPGKYRFFFIDQTVGEMEGGVFRLLKGKWKCTLHSHSETTTNESVVEEDYTNGTSESENYTSNDDRISCPTCYGEQEVSCSLCDGKGKKHCGNCGGDGWDRNGNRCLNCNGGGIVFCSELQKCSSCKGYGYGYLKTCSICNGTAENENGEACSCTNMFHNVIGGILSTVLGEGGDDEISRNIKGISIKEYPGYLFFAPE
jgi:hypothetical protein